MQHIAGVLTFQNTHCCLDERADWAAHAGGKSQDDHPLTDKCFFILTSEELDHI